MHIGLATGFAHQRGDSYPDAQFVREELDNLVLAEELGFDSVWITEHHFSDYSMSNDPLQLLTYVAGRTKRIKLGTQCIIVPVAQSGAAGRKDRQSRHHVERPGAARFRRRARAA